MNSHAHAAVGTVVRAAASVVIAGVALAATARQAAADMVSFSVSGSGSDGSLGASLTFKTINGGIQVVVNNTDSGTLNKGQAISAFSFAINGLSAPSTFVDLSGRSFNPSSGGGWTSTSGTAFDNAGVNSIDHWGFATSGSNVTLATAGTGAPAGNPQYMILPAAGTAASGQSLSNSNFNPYIIGPATFTLLDAGVTSGTSLAGDISGIQVAFGTGPDTTLVSSAAPLPASLAGSLVLLSGFTAGYGLYRKMKPAGSGTVA